MNNQSKKVAIITGAGQGMGKAVALNLASESCNIVINDLNENSGIETCLLYTSPSPRDGLLSRMPSSA